MTRLGRTFAPAVSFLRAIRLALRRLFNLEYTSGRSAAFSPAAGLILLFLVPSVAALCCSTQRPGAAAAHLFTSGRLCF